MAQFVYRKRLGGFLLPSDQFATPELSKRLTAFQPGFGIRARSARDGYPEKRKKHILGSGYATARKRAVESIIWSQRSHLLG
jgi:hypothetical protein